MKVKKVNRYYCEYCSKAGCAAGHMRKHELHCTMNPGRVCRMCKTFGLNQREMSDILKLLPDFSWYTTKGQEGQRWNKALENAMVKLRYLTDNCPACILAALRQSVFEAYMYVHFFDYKKECEKAWDAYNKKQRRLDEMSTY